MKKQDLMGIVIFGVSFFSAAAFADRKVTAIFFPASYYYLQLANPSTVAQEVRVTFQSSGFRMKRGGFPSEYFHLLGPSAQILNGDSTPTGVAGQLVTCDASNLSYTCTLTNGNRYTIPAGGFLRVGTMSEPCPGTWLGDAGVSGACRAWSTSSTIGVMVTIEVVGDSGFIIGTGMSFSDVSNATIHADKAFPVPINGGRPF